MRILAFSDVHRNRGKAQRLVELASQADVVVGAGDFASMHLGLGRTIDALSAISKPTLFVPGNNETDAALSRACAGFSAARVLHGDAVNVNNVEFFGLGAGVPPTPLPWSFDLSEDRATQFLEGLAPGAVLIVHSPPKGRLDKAFGRHLGSSAIRDAIEDKQPPLVLCGHIHQCAGRETMLGESRVANVGPDGAFFEV